MADRDPRRLPAPDDIPDEPRDEFLESVARELRRPSGFSADFDARLMDAIRAEGTPSADAPPPVDLPGDIPRDSSPDERVIEGPWTQPRRRRFAPVRGFLAAAAIGTIAVLGVRAAREQARTTSVATVPAAAPTGPSAQQVAVDPTALRQVEFELEAPDARSVSVVGTFNDWDVGATPMERGGDGVWRIALQLRPGRYVYSFVVDGEKWVADPSAPPSGEDDFGRPSSALTVDSTGPIGGTR